MGTEPSITLSLISDELSAADEPISKLQTLSYYADGSDDRWGEEQILTEHELEWRLERAYIGLSALIEHLQYPKLLAQFQSGFSKFESNLSNVDIIPDVGDFYSPAQSYLRKYIFALSVLLGSDMKRQDQIERRSMLEGILLNTPKIIFDRRIEPRNEAEVRKCVFDLLIHIFPDTVREMSIIQNTKTYRPDIGVKSLGTAVEYKYADTPEEVKHAVGGLYEDMRGYSGSKDWTFFYAVIYMTDHFFTQQQIMSEFKHTSADSNWKPLLVVGKGARVRRRRAA